MKEGEVIKCPECDGTGKVRDWAVAIMTSGLASLFGEDKEECPKCGGTGYIRVVVRG
jgi:DnaJ-class molecular chaperone